MSDFFSELVLRRNTSKNTQNIALSALAIYFSEILKRPLNDIGHIPSRRAPKLPVVLTTVEIAGLFAKTVWQIFFYVKADVWNRYANYKQ